MEHIRVADEDAGVGAHPGASARGSVAIIHANWDAQVPGQNIHEKGKFILLVLGEGFGGKEIEGTTFGHLEQALKDGQVVREGLATGSGGDDHQILTSNSMLPGQGLMAIELTETAGLQSGFQSRVEIVG